MFSINSCTIVIDPIWIIVWSVVEKLKLWAEIYLYSRRINIHLRPAPLFSFNSQAMLLFSLRTISIELVSTLKFFFSNLAIKFKIQLLKKWVFALLFWTRSGACIGERPRYFKICYRLSFLGIHNYIWWIKISGHSWLHYTVKPRARPHITEIICFFGERQLYWNVLVLIHSVICLQRKSSPFWHPHPHLLSPPQRFS